MWKAAMIGLALSLGLLAGLSAPGEAAAAQPTPINDAQPATPEQLHDWVVSSGDNNRMPFVIVDKVQATVSVYDSTGELLGAAPALVGAATGDGSVPGIGDRELSAIAPGDRTTPAGRFVAAYGASRGQGKVLWVDFATAISLHPVVTTNRAEQRPERLASPTPEDNRITFGCINVPREFYDQVVRTAFTERGVVYVLPDTKSVEEVFPSFGVYLRTSSAAGQTSQRLISGEPASRGGGG